MPSGRLADAAAAGYVANQDRSDTYWHYPHHLTEISPSRSAAGRAAAPSWWRARSPPLRVRS